MDRRSFLKGIFAIAAPAVIRTPGLLMPIRSIIMPEEVSLYSALAAETRRAFLPSIFIQIYASHPLTNMFERAAL